jgi:hypothetical protein
MGTFSQVIISKVPEEYPCLYSTFATCALLVVIAVVSLVCIALSLSLHEYYEPKSDLGVLVAVPGLCLTASTMAYV